MSAIVQAFKDADLRKKIIFTIVMIIAYRVGAQIRLRVLTMRLLLAVCAS